MISPHLFHLHDVPPQAIRDGGSRKTITKSNFPILQGMSLYRLSLYPNAIREPHWHANADELGYCLKGKIILSFYGSGDDREKFLVNQGEAFYIPSGTLHSIENSSEATSELVLQFSHEEPEDFSLTSVFGMFSDAVLGNTWDVKSEVFQTLGRSTEAAIILASSKTPAVPEEARYTSPYHFNIQGSSSFLINGGGSVKVARQNVWPILKRQALYLLELTSTGMREPHWHPETAELGFVQQGEGRMSIQSPTGSVDTYIMKEGDAYFIPKAYPHHIENIKDSFLNLIIFFDQAMPQDIGFSASVKSFSNELLTTVMKSPAGFFDHLPTYYKDRFIVNKINPVDPF